MRVPYEKPGLGVEPNWEALGEPEYTIEWRTKEYTIEWERKSIPLNEDQKRLEEDLTFFQW